MDFFSIRRFPLYKFQFFWFWLPQHLHTCQWLSCGFCQWITECLVTIYSRVGAASGCFKWCVWVCDSVYVCARARFVWRYITAVVWCTVLEATTLRSSAISLKITKTSCLLRAGKIHCWCCRHVLNTQEQGENAHSEQDVDAVSSKRLSRTVVERLL